MQQHCLVYEFLWIGHVTIYFFVLVRATVRLGSGLDLVSGG